MVTMRKLFALTALVSVLATVALGGMAAQKARAPNARAAHRPAVTGLHGLVTAGHSLASMAGLRILMKGGNAADASVAILATLNQVEPMMSGAGGNGFMTIYDKRTDHVYSLNATGAAPMAITADEVTPQELSRGMKAGVVPGLFGGWIALLDRFGTMGLAEVLAPAIDYAENGHPLDPYVANSITQEQSLFQRFPSTARVFLPDGSAPVPGQLLKYRDLAGTLKKVVEAERSALRQGRTRSKALRAAFDRFYKGDIAQEMARFYAENDGLFTAEDFAAYEPIWAEPVHASYRGYDVYTTPSTSRGGLEVVMQLNLIEGYDLEDLGHNSAEALHLVAESIKLAKSDIYHFVADPEFTEMPIGGMTSEAYAMRRRSSIDLDRAMAYPDHGNPPGAERSALKSPWKVTPPVGRPVFAEESYVGSTTSFSVADEFGNVVVCTPTLGSAWGTGVVVGNTGLFFNNGTRIGSTSPYPDDVNYVRGGQIPILNNSPIVVMKDGEFFLSLGTPGGEGIGQTQFQVLLNILDFGLGIQEAIEAPRFRIHADPNFYKLGADLIMHIEGGVSPAVMRKLKEMGHKVQPTSAYSTGNMQGILVNPETGTMTAGADLRRMMYAIGW